MTRLVLRRVALILPTLLGVVTLVFAFVRLLPGDPVEIMLGESAAPADVQLLRHDLGLDRPLPEQYIRFLGAALRGDLGDSLAFHEPVATVIAGRLPATIELATAAFLLALAVGVPAGAMAAARAGSSLDRIARVISLVGLGVPSFWLGPVLILTFAIHRDWLPVSGRGGPAHLILPAVTLAAGMAALLLRLTRTSVLAIRGADFVRTAEAKGLEPGRVLVRHTLRNALLPVATVAGLQAGSLLAGAIVTETIFAWPGLGRLVVQAIAARDYPLLQGCVLAIGTTYVAINLLTDLLHLTIDPRLRGGTR